MFNSRENKTGVTQIPYFNSFSYPWLHHIGYMTFVEYHATEQNVLYIMESKLQYISLSLLKHGEISPERWLRADDYWQDTYINISRPQKMVDIL